MDKDKQIKRTLDILIKDIKTIEDIKLIRYTIDDYIEEGYKVEEYIERLNNIIHSFYFKYKVN